MSLGVYHASCENVKELLSSRKKLKKLFNNSIRSKADCDVSLFTNIYALLYSAYVETSFQKLINTPNGFGESIIKNINEQNNIEDKWKKCIEIALNYINDSDKGSLANKKKRLEYILNEYIIEPSKIRNKIAHGQWAKCLNEKCDAVNGEFTTKLKNIDFVKIDRLFNIYVDYQQCIQDIIVSVKAHYRDYYILLCKLEEYIERTKTWSFDTKKKKILESKKMYGYNEIMHRKCK